MISDQSTSYAFQKCVLKAFVTLSIQALPLSESVGRPACALESKTWAVQALGKHYAIFVHKLMLTKRMGDKLEVCKGRYGDVFNGYPPFKGDDKEVSELGESQILVQEYKGLLASAKFLILHPPY